MRTAQENSADSFVAAALEDDLRISVCLQDQGAQLERWGSAEPRALVCVQRTRTFSACGMQPDTKGATKSSAFTLSRQAVQAEYCFAVAEKR